MRQSMPLYLLTIALLGVAVYLHSPVVAISIVALWGVQASEGVFTRKNKDADIVEMQEALKAYKSKMDLLSHDIHNVQERAKVILGENY